MPVTVTYPGVYIEEVSSGVRSISGVATSIALFVGWAPRGPIDRATRISSFSDYNRLYGGLDGRAWLGYSVKHFFDNGGADAYVLRIAADEAKVAGNTLSGMTIAASSPGEWANVYSLRLTTRPSPDASRFRLDVIHEPSKNSVVETFENLSMSPTDPRYVRAIVNAASSLIRITEDPPGGTTPTNGIVPLDDSSQKGTDGPVIQPGDPSFHVKVAAAFSTGGILDRIDLFNLVCVPGLSDASIIQSLQASCRRRRAFLLVDAPEAASVADAPNALNNLTGSDAMASALYYPWVSAADPLQSGAVRHFPPCGFVAGIYARTDSSRGVWKAPAGIDASLNGALGLKVVMSDAENGQLNPQAINCLRSFTSYGHVVWGARTLAGNNDRGSEYKYVPIRRLAFFIEESLYRGTQWVVFEPNDEPLWAQIRLNVGAFMQGLFRQGAFQGTSAKEAYFVKCDRETTTQNDINLGIVNILVGFAPLKPAEFVVIQLQQMAGQIAV